MVVKEIRNQSNQCGGPFLYVIILASEFRQDLKVTPDSS